jgi:peroxiredoxin
MVRILKILVVIALAAVLVAGVTVNAGCDSCSTDDISNGNNHNGDVANGDEPNGDEPNGDVPNGDVPNGDGLARPDLISGFGLVIDCEEFSGQIFQDGDPAPVFRFEDASGQTFALSDFQGRAVVLNFWRTDCGWCVYELPYIEQVYDDWPEDELVIIAIDIGEANAKVRDFLDDIEVSVPVLLDREALVTAQYRVSSMPITFFIDKEGLIRGIKFGAFQSAGELDNIVEQLVSL